MLLSIGAFFPHYLVLLKRNAPFAPGDVDHHAFPHYLVLLKHSIRQRHRLKLMGLSTLFSPSETEEEKK